MNAGTTILPTQPDEQTTRLIATKHNLELDTPITYIKKVGPKRSEAFDSVGVKTAGDLLRYYPRRYIDRRSVTPIAQLEEGQIATVAGEVVSFGLERGRKSRFRMILEDETDALSCVWFNGIRFVKNRFKAGDNVAVHGKVSLRYGPSIVHPEYDKLEEGSDQINTGAIIPLYPSSEALRGVGLDSRGIRRILKGVIDDLSSLTEEFLSDDLKAEWRLVDLAQALKQIHFPESQESLGLSLKRLKFDELFFFMVMLALRRRSVRDAKNGVAYKEVGDLLPKLYESLPFELTSAQKRVIREIRSDMAEKVPMQRLLQGDVGTGKTVVAMLVSAIAISAGYQVALMAPTEILAEQHHGNAEKMLGSLGVIIVSLKGGQAMKDRKETLEAVASGECNLIIGTHALLYGGVEFSKLGLVIIDEQHRFGVEQRAALSEKGVNPDVLVMTATPIPRTLALSLYGDLDISFLDEYPSGSRRVRTEVRGGERRKKIYGFLNNVMDEGRQVFIVYPLVEESEKIDLQAATEGYERLSKKIFPDRSVALLHGRMTSDEKDDIMRRYAAGEIDLLVSTSVIEVGIDVPNATVMVVENAERFGLAQLHQMRGRIGRGGDASYFIMLSDSEGEAARNRLEVLCSTDDGFIIAEEDLKQRGQGDFFGKRQHGMPDFKLADLATDSEIVRMAHATAFEVIDGDPHLRKRENRALRDRFMIEYAEKLNFATVG